VPPKLLQKQTCFSSTDNSLNLDVRLVNAISSNDPDVIKFLLVMALCNTVVPIRSNGDTVSYKAQSQDEVALVNAAGNLNMMLISKDSSTAG